MKLKALRMQFQRFMDETQFLAEIRSLRVFRNGYVDASLLENLEEAGLLYPRLRIRYPDAVARRLWLEAHEPIQCQLKLPVEPEGQRWDAAVELVNALYRWRNYFVYGPSSHPLDDPEPRFSEFIQDPKKVTFKPRMDRRVDVSSDLYDVLLDTSNIEEYYSSWQVLWAAEVADAGVHMRINLADRDIAQATREALDGGRIPDGVRYSINLMPVHAARDFSAHERALDSVVWFAEERWRVLSDITAKHGGGRFRLSSGESARYSEASRQLAVASTDRFLIDGKDLTDLIRFLAEYWSNWKRNGRPQIALAYKQFLECAVILTRYVEDITFAELRDRIGRIGGWFKPVLDVIWPSWVESEKDRVRRTLKSALDKKVDNFVVADFEVEEFLIFLATEGHESFFWRLNSFENHVFRGNEFAIEGMRGDVQGMAIAVEHIAVSLGATKTQLHEKFKQLWKDANVLHILKRGDVAPLARVASLADDWSGLKAKINALREEPGGEIAADLVMAHRIRGGVHTLLPEDDYFELESLFLGLMRAALITFVEVRRNRRTA